MHELAKPLLAGRRCLKTRHISSTCTACIDICPEKALAVKEKHLVFGASQCTGCGACISVCPQDALIAPVFTDEAFEAVLRREAPLGRIVFATLNAAAEEKKVSVPSLLYLTTDRLLFSTALGARAMTLIFTPGSADERALPVIERRLAILKKILSEFHLPLHVEIRCAKPRIDASRRRFFAGFGARLGEGSELEPESTEAKSRIAKSLAEEPFVRVPQSRSRLLFALATLREASGNKESPEASRCFTTPAIDPGKCSACALCAAVCPTGALQTVRGNGKSKEALRLMLDAKACTGCRLCADICFMNAVDLHEETTLERALNPAPRQLFAASKDSHAFDTWEEKLSGMINAPIYRT